MMKVTSYLLTQVGSRQFPLICSRTMCNPSDDQPVAAIQPLGHRRKISPEERLKALIAESGGEEATADTNEAATQAASEDNKVASAEDSGNDNSAALRAQWRLASLRRRSLSPAARVQQLLKDENTKID